MPGIRIIHQPPPAGGEGKRSSRDERSQRPPGGRHGRLELALWRAAPWIIATIALSWRTSASTPCTSCC